MRTGDFVKLYGLKHDFICLIRPDGHIGFVEAPPTQELFVDYLLRICTPSNVRQVLIEPSE